MGSQVPKTLLMTKIKIPNKSKAYGWMPRINCIADSQKLDATETEDCGGFLSI